MFDFMQRTVNFIRRTRRKDRMASIAKKRLLRKKNRKHLLSFFPKDKSTQTSGSVFPERIELFKETNYELELMEIVDCFLVSYGIGAKYLVTVKI